MRHKEQPSQPGEPLLQSVQESLTQVEHQIWLLRNILWWYLLPFTFSILAFFAHCSWLSALETNNWLAALGFALFLFTFVLVIYSFIYYLNQRAVRVQLEPRRQELLALFTSLRDETTSDVRGEYPILMSAGRVRCSPRRMFVASLCVLATLLIVVPVILFLASEVDQDYPKESPFAAVRWQKSQPEVKVGDEWFKLVSVDELPASAIVAFSQRTYGDKWQKRFEEDLVELLTRMGHAPQDEVTLVVQSLTSSDTRTLEDVPMTRANRRAIRDAAQARERGE
jgi:magnesium-transporting ATPase (P-type)